MAPCNLYSMLPMARSWPGQLAYGTATPLGPDDTWDTWRIWLDPVLSPEEQLDFAHLLLENPLLTFADGFLYDQSQTSEDAFCQIVGVADEEGHVLYPKTITYIYPDRETCILDSNSSFFHNKELTTMQFQSISLFSGLTEMGPSPEQALRYWQQAGERAASMYQATRILMRQPSHRMAAPASLWRTARFWSAAASTSSPFLSSRS